MTFNVLSKDSDGHKPYRYTQIVAVLTTPYTIKLITKTNKVISLERDLIVNIMIEDVNK
jgi:hypothetical protein